MTIPYTNLAIIIGSTIAVVLIVRFAFGVLAKRAARTEGKRDDHLVQLTGALVQIIVFATAIVLVLNQFDVHLMAVLGVSSGLGLAVGFALRGTIENLIAGVQIYVRGTFKPGHEIKIVGEQGIVEKTTFAETRLVQGDGDIVIIPNKNFIGAVLTRKSKQQNRSLSSTLKIAPTEVIERLEEFAAEVGQELNTHGCFFGPSIQLLDYNDEGYAIYISVYVHKGHDFGTTRWKYHKLIESIVTKMGLSLGGPPTDTVIHWTDPIQVNDVTPKPVVRRTKPGGTT